MREPNADPHGLLDPSYRTDPYPALARLREHAPVYRFEPWNCWLITRYEDVVTCFRDDRLSADRAGGYAASLPPAIQTKLAPLIGNFARWALMKDPPDHTRLRGLINKAFTPRLITHLRPRVEAICDELLDEIAAKGSFDLIDDYAFPVPVLVIGEMLGLPPEDASRLKKWSTALSAFLGATAMRQEIVAAALGAIVELEVYFREQFAMRRANPGEDLISSLLAAHEQDDRLDEAELLATCTMVLFGGHETTTNLIGNGTKILLDHPEALASVRALPEDAEGEQAMAAAVEELLRYDSPILRMGRVTKEAIDLRGVEIPAGERVYLMMAAANRDAAQFEDPDRLDLGRANNRQLSFGHGRHFCVGAALGRLEGQIALRKLVGRFPTLRALDSDQVWLDNLTIRGLARYGLAC
ncbi:cytochrome P450 [Pseudenhygromyxa sp. WMMC2535]|uniref:cytochrome P450 n=1 Tax=Pseudenhygromyxa sp. WMMC2535 TaxID=2712867 RepID=UPI00155808C1|nr:cytochrome P450 [Pseudenhygromyxa sp. WMMC2535]NVB39332.1 cytochrome P450 [Pseudenhygromyxa sp. WMMC2535]